MNIHFSYHSLIKLSFQAKEVGFFKTEVDAAEVAEEMSRERKNFQLQMCDVRKYLWTMCVMALEYCETIIFSHYNCINIVLVTLDSIFIHTLFAKFQKH